MLKRLFKILVVFVLLFIITLVALPFVFKGKIVNTIKTEANKQLNATLDFGSFDISLIRSFPDFSFKIEDVVITGVDTFENLELVRLGELRTSVDLMSVFKGDNFSIKSFGLKDAYVHVRVLKNGMANYDIAITKEVKEEINEEIEEESEDLNFQLQLKSYTFENFNLVYDDKMHNMYTNIQNLNHQGSGDFTQDNFLLKTLTKIDKFTFRYDGIDYLKQVESELKMDIEIDMPKFKFTFAENSLRINNLVLNMDGFVAMPEDDIDMDLTFNTPSTDFKDLISLVPSVYSADFKDLKTKGNFVLNGFAKGTYTATNLPAFDLQLTVNDGKIQYPDLPQAIDNIQMALKINNPGGSEDNTIIDLSAFHMEIGDNPIDANFYLSHPISDPFIKAAVQSQLDFSSLKEVIPEEEINYTGSLTADFAMQGLLSTLENEEYEKFNAAGQIILLDFLLVDTSMKYNTYIEKAYFNFSPQFLELSKLVLNLGKTDLSIKGRVEQYLPYYFHNKTLIANLDILSDYMDMDELMGTSPDETQTEPAENEIAESESADVTEPLEIPANIRFTAKAKINKMVYDSLPITNIYGNLNLNDGRLILDKFKMNMLNGEVSTNGEFNTLKPNQPFFSFNAAVNKLDVHTTFITFNTVASMAPIAENANGAFSGNINMAGFTNANLDVDLNSLYGDGSILTHQVVVGGSDFLQKVANVMKNDKYKQLLLNDVNIKFAFKDGKMDVEPFDIKIGQSKANISGSSYFDERIDYLIAMDVPTSEFGGLGATAASAIQSLVGKTAASINVGDRLKVDLLVNGTVTDPKITPRFGAGENTSSDLKSKAADELKRQKEALENRAKEEVEKAKEDAERKLRDEKAKRIEQANKKGDELIAQAKRQGDNLRTESKNRGEQLVKEAEQQRAKLIKDAGNNPIKKKAAEVAGDKLVSEAKKQSDNLQNEADKQASDLLSKAESEKIKLIEEASK